MSFDGVLIGRMQSNNRYVVYDEWKAGMLYIIDVYGVYGVK